MGSVDRLWVDSLSIVVVLETCLGNRKVGDYEMLVNNMLSTFHDLRCNMSIKLYFLCSHFNQLPEYLGDLSDE